MKKHCKAILSSKACWSALMCTVGLIAMPAAAQTPGSAPPPQADDTVQGTDALGDIIVTARRRAETLQSIPASVVAVTGEGLEKAGVRQLSDLQKSISGLSFASLGGAQPQISLRGDFNRIGSTEPGVGVFVDGVYLTRFTLLSQNPLDAARVEVLKGPQSTLYGKNTVAGAINIITADPTFDWEGYAEAGYGSSSQQEDIYHVSGVLSGPLVEDKVAFRVAGTIAHRDGYLRDRVSGARGLGYHDKFIRAKLLFTPTEDLSIKLSASYDHRNAPRLDRLLVFPGSSIPFSAPGTNLQRDTGPTAWDTRTEIIPFSKTKSYQFTAQVDLESAIGTLSSISAYQHSTLNQLTDIDGTANRIATQTVLDRDAAFSQEIRLAGSEGGVTWLGGIYYLNDRNSGFALNADFFPLSGQNALLGIARQEASIPSYSETVGVFGQVGYDITDNLNILGGLRYSSDDRRFPLNFRFIGINGQVFPGAIVDLQRGKTFRAVTGNAVLTYKLSPHARMYASYSSGNKAGGFNPTNNPLAAVVPYNEQLIEAYEIGLKSELFDNRLKLNLAGFYSDISDLQVQRLQAVGNGQFALLTQNAASARAPGVEVEVLANITSNFKINAAYTYQDAVIKTYQFSPTVLLTDIPVPRSPKHSGVVGLTYSGEVGPGELEVGGNVSFRSGFTNDIVFTPAENLLQTLPLNGYEVVNLTATYSWDRFQLRAYVNNVFNKQYFVGGVIAARAFDQPTTPGEPRTFEVSFRVSL